MKMWVNAAVKCGKEALDLLGKGGNSGVGK